MHAAGDGDLFGYTVGADHEAHGDDPGRGLGEGGQVLRVGDLDGGEQAGWHQVVGRGRGRGLPGGLGFVV